MSNINIIKEEKFKDILISLRFASKMPVNRSARAILSIMLSDRTLKYDSKVKMNEKLDHMFGATLASSIFSYGYSNVIDLSSSTLSQRFVSDDLLEDHIEFLSEVVYAPLLNEAVFKEAKIMLSDIIEREKDNIGSYVINQALKVAGKNYPLENSRYGSLEQLKSLTLDEVKAAYEAMLNDDSLTIMVVGDVDEVHFKSLFQSYFKEHTSKEFKSNYLLKSDEVSVVEKTMHVPSPNFALIYNTHVLNVGREYWALQLMSMVLGQLPNSYLFQEVREKRSLTYSIRSMVGGYDGILLISSGVRDGSMDEAIKISQEQIARIQAHDVNEVLFKSAQAMLINNMYQVEDSNRRLVDRKYREIILDENYSTEELIHLVSTITIDEIVAVANKLELNTIYKINKGGDDVENI